MKVTIAQLNPVIGDIEGNLDKALKAIGTAASGPADLIVFPELYITGYPPRDLLERPQFIARARAAIERLAAESVRFPETGIIVGAPIEHMVTTGRGLYNAAVLLYRGEVVFQQYKSLLPSYDVFDETRYFDTAPTIATVPFKGEVLGLAICEDVWNDPDLWPRRNYALDPIEQLVDQGATMLVSIAASPFHVGKDRTRLRIISHDAAKYRVPVVLVNQVGGNDELVFDGRSMCVDAEGRLVAALPGFSEVVQTIDMALPGTGAAYEPDSDIAQVHDALVLGLRDYLRKTGFAQVVLGLSGGIDSAVTCALAVAAVGAENVLGVAMPSQYSSAGSVEDARQLAANLGIAFALVPIQPMFDAFVQALAEPFAGREPDVTEENIQARVRGTVLMAFSNKQNRLLLATGNKSEVAVGYCTLYGDMCGGLAVISDVPKVMVYALAAHINRERELVPQATIDKAPSAELRPGQTDQDSLPPYDVLDRILRAYVDQGASMDQLLQMGFDAAVVRWVIRTIDRNEYKRRQAAPGLKVTTKAFGMGRRMAIAARYET